MPKLQFHCRLVPITGQTLAVGLAATILGSRYGTSSVLLYLFIGAAGVPVFAEMSGGLAKDIRSDWRLFIILYPDSLYYRADIGKNTFLSCNGFPCKYNRDVHNVDHRYDLVEIYELIIMDSCICQRFCPIYNRRHFKSIPCILAWDYDPFKVSIS